MDFDELYKSAVPDEKSILEAVDEYTLYCFYTGIENLVLGKSYPAPYRRDEIPSFSVFRTTKYAGIEYFWKDHGNGESGSIFRLIQRIEVLDSLQEVIQRINEDFQLGLDLDSPTKREKIIHYEAPIHSIIKLRIAETPLTEAGINFWKQFDIAKPLLDFYNTTQVKWYWSYDSQQAPSTVPDPTFAYRIGEYYQVYSPFAPRQHKFRNDLPEHYFFGYMQISESGKTLIIDKSCKDVIFCRRLGYEAVCGKSETTLIPERKMLELKDRFENIYLMLDPDAAGKKQTEKYVSLYPWLKPRFLINAKDKTDLVKKVGFEQAENEIRQLVQ